MSLRHDSCVERHHLVEEDAHATFTNSLIRKGSDRCSVLMAQIAGEELNCKWSCRFNSGAIQVFIMVNCLWQLTRPLTSFSEGRWFDSRVCVGFNHLSNYHERVASRSLTVAAPVTGPARGKLRALTD